MTKSGKNSVKELTPLEEHLLSIAKGRPSPLPEFQSRSAGNQFYEIFCAWVARGGTGKNGKPRHGVRPLADKRYDTGVLSPQARIDGVVSLSKSDARKMLSTFFIHWFGESYTKERPTTADDDKPLPTDEAGLERIVEHLVGQWFPDKDTKLYSRKLDVSSGVEFLNSAATEKDVTIVVSRTSSLTGTNVADTLRAFRRAISPFAKTPPQVADGYHVWVLDFGNRRVTEREDYEAFLNVEFVRTALLSVALFHEASAAKADGGVRLPVASVGRHHFVRENNNPFWDALERRACVIVRNLPNARAFIEAMDHEDSLNNNMPSGYFGDFENLDATHFLPNEVPKAWADDPQIRKKVFTESTIDPRGIGFVVTGKRADHEQGIMKFEYWLSPATSKEKQRASMEKKPRTPSRARNGEVSSLNAPSPGDSYELAASLIYLAACHRLSVFQPGDAAKRRSPEAISILRRKGFEAMRLQDFLNHHLIHDMDDPSASRAGEL